MTAPSESQIAAVLAEHEYLGENQAGNVGCWGCTWQGPHAPGLHADHRRAAHRAHVAAVLAALFAERDAEQRREAEVIWERGAYAGRQYQKYLSGWDRIGPAPEMPPNPYAAETYPKEIDR